ncbi:MAG: RNA 3'-terminal phosphate cyclase [Acidobacteria bacterium]|nr:RNA 3'-terminal phosphate cyclase [Acidobacteriota bacterium]
MLIIDGSFGEGGGQILRTSLGLSLVTGTAFRIEKIRGGRKSPGILRQHLTAINAAAKIGQAEVVGASLNSQQLTFIPKKVLAGDYSFAIGTAGSATLVLQTILPALLLADGPTNLILEGGTHNPAAPPFDFLEKTFLKQINRMGVNVTLELVRPGFYPAGGGQFKVNIKPVKKLLGFELTSRGEIISRRARALVASLPTEIADRELSFIAQRMSWDKSCLHKEIINNSRGPGNVVFIELESENLTEIFTAFGERGVRAEAVADEAVKEARHYLAAGVPVGEYLADQLLIPFALAGSGVFTTFGLSLHTTTNIEIIKKFLKVNINTKQLGKLSTTIEIA